MEFHGCGSGRQRGLNQPLTSGYFCLNKGRAARSLGGGMMVVADNAGDFPGAVFALPEVNEAGLANAFGVFMAGMVEAMDTHFDGAESLHIVNLQASGDEFASHFATDIFL